MNSPSKKQKIEKEENTYFSNMQYDVDVNSLGFEGKLLHYGVQLDIDSIKNALKEDTQLTCKIDWDFRTLGCEYIWFYFDGYSLGGYDQHLNTYECMALANEECTCKPPDHPSLSHIRYTYDGKVCSCRSGCLECRTYGHHKIHLHL